MKKLLFTLLMVWGIAHAQTTGKLRYDSTMLLKEGGNNELILLNGSRAITGGVLTNIGNGRTAFVIPSGGAGGIDTIYRIPGKDSIFWTKNGNTYKVKDSTGGGSSAGSRSDSLNLYGKIYEKSTWASTTDFNNNGSTPSVISGKIRQDDGTGNFARSIDINTTLKGTNGNTDLNQYKIYGRFTVVTPGNGFWLGKRSLSIAGPTGICGWFSPATGNVYIVQNSTGTIFATSATTLAVSTNDSVSMEFEQDLGFVSATVRNLTTSSAELKVTFNYSLPSTIVPNISKFAVGAVGGTNELDSISVTSKARMYASVATVLDSKNLYNTTSYANSFPVLMSQSYLTVNLSGAGEQSLDWWNRIGEIISLKPKQLLLFNPSNDKRFVVDVDSTKARYYRTERAARANNIQVYHVDAIYESSSDPVDWVTYIHATRSQDSIISVYYTIKQNASIALAGDGTHLTDIGARLVSEQIVQSGKLQHALPPIPKALALTIPTDNGFQGTVNNEGVVTLKTSLTTTNVPFIGDNGKLREAPGNLFAYDSVNFRLKLNNMAIGGYPGISTIPLVWMNVSPNTTNWSLGGASGNTLLNHVSGGSIDFSDGGTYFGQFKSSALTVGSSYATSGGMTYRGLFYGNTSTVPLILKMSAGQGVNAFHIHNSNGTKMYGINTSGYVSAITPLITAGLVSGDTVTFKKDSVFKGVTFEVLRDSIQRIPRDSAILLRTYINAVAGGGGGGSGTVNAGLANQLAYYPSNGTAVSGVAVMNVNSAVATNASGLPVASATTATELGYVSGVTSAIQTQLNAKVATSTDPAIVISGTTINLRKSFTNLTDAGTVTVVPTTTGYNYNWTLGGNRTLAWTSPQDGTALTFFITQDATGGRTLTGPSGNAIPLDPAPNAETVVSVIRNGSTYKEFGYSPVVIAGTYSPTPTGVSNIDAAGANVNVFYQRIGNIVHVTGNGSVDATVIATTTSFTLSLPISSALTNANQLSGLMGEYSGTSGIIEGDAATDTAKFTYVSGSTSARTFSFTFSYTLL